MSVRNAPPGRHRRHPVVRPARGGLGVAAFLLLLVSALLLGTGPAQAGLAQAGLAQADQTTSESSPGDTTPASGDAPPGQGSDQQQNDPQQNDPQKNHKHDGQGSNKKPGKPDAQKPDNQKPQVVAPVPPPATPGNLPAEVDPLADYQGQGICDITPKVGTDKLTKLIQSTYATSNDVWAPRDCAEGGRSEHKEYRAIDWMINSRVPTENAQAESFLNWLLATDANGNKFAMARRLGVMYIGWKDRIWESYTQQWTELKGCYSTPQPDYDTYCHRNHIHISLSWDGAAGFTSFWGGTPNPTPFCDEYASASSDAMPVGNGLDFVPVTPTRLVDSRAGMGTSGNEPCRITMDSAGGDGAPLAINVRDRKDAPKDGVRAVAVRVVSVGSNSPATLHANTTGDATLVETPPDARREVMTILPVGSDGTIAVTTNSGATYLIVDLLGYFVKPASAVGVAGRFLPQAGEVVFDTKALKQPLAPGEKRVIDLSAGSTSGGAPAADLLSVTVTSTAKPGELVFRRAGEVRTPATTTIDYRRSAQSTTTILAPLDPDGHITVVNNGAGPVDISMALQAAAVRTTELGSLLVPVDPAPVTGARTTLQRVLDGKAKAEQKAARQAQKSTQGHKPTHQKPTAQPAAKRPVARKSAMMAGVPVVVASGTPTATTPFDASSATAAVLQVTVRATGKGGTVTFWSLAQPKSPSLVISRQSTTTGLIVVPLDQAGTIHRTIEGSGLEVQSSVVAYLR